MPRRETPQFIWVPPDRTTKWEISIDSLDLHDYILSAKFTRSLFGEEMGCDIELDNSGEDFTDRFTYGHIIQFKMDFTDGSTVQWEGKLEEIRKKDTFGFNLQIRGSHYTADTLDVTVTEDFTGANVSTILTNIISTYLSSRGFTSTNVGTTTTTTDIKWSNKPFFDCVVDLMRIADYDCYVDNNKDFHFFPKNPSPNEEEAMVWDDGLIELSGLGSDAIDVRNKIIVYGDAGGLPVVHTSEDSDSQTTFGVKEKVIQDSSIVNSTQATDAGDSEKDQQKNPPVKGTALGLFMPTLAPGDTLYVIYPPHNVHDAFRVAKYTFSVPEETEEVTFSKEVSVSQLFKDRVKKSTQQEKIVNPYKMKYSYNFTFDDFTGIDQGSSSNVSISDGKLIFTAAGGTMISSAQEAPITATQAHILTIGEDLANATVYVSADGNTPIQLITPNTLVTFDTPGNRIKVKVVGATTTAVDSLAILYK